MKKTIKQKVLIFIIGLFIVSCVGNNDKDEVTSVPIKNTPIYVPKPTKFPPAIQEQPPKKSPPKQQQVWKQPEHTLPPIELKITPKEYPTPIQTGTSLDIKIGQMLMVGFRGLSVHNKSTIVRDITKYHLGGVILFDYDITRKSWRRNISSPNQVKRLVNKLQSFSQIPYQVKKLVNKLQSFSQIPLFIAIDQEGGKIRRLKQKFGFSRTTSAQYLGRKNDFELTYKTAAKIASTLNNLGINFNFAPVVDLNINPNNPIIGKLERSFSDNPDIVIQHALTFIKAHHKYGVLCAIKHFPGHGSSNRDSHLGLVDVTDTWEKIELNPYIALINDVDAIMVAHIFNRNYDPIYPATLSKKIVNDLLRSDLGYKGVVVSDDMQMKAITNHYEFKDAILATIMAGIDIIVIGNNLKYEKNITARTVNIIKQLIREDKISEKRIDESYRRIKDLKERLSYRFY